MSVAPDSLRSLPRARTLRRTAIVGAASAAAVLLFAGPALAHVTISPDSAPAGGTAELTFRVPNEEAKAYTVKIDVQIPTDHPIAQLLVKPVTGWTATVKTITLAKPVTTDDGTFNQAVSEVIWSGGKILPGQFQDFSISADPLPHRHWPDDVQGDPDVFQRRHRPLDRCVAARSARARSSSARPHAHHVKGAGDYVYGAHQHRTGRLSLWVWLRRPFPCARGGSPRRGPAGLPAVTDGRPAGSAGDD